MKNNTKKIIENTWKFVKVLGGFIVIGLLIYPVFSSPYVKFIEYKISQCKEKNIVFIYDDFKYYKFWNNDIVHGEVMVDIFKTVIDKNACEPIEIQGSFISSKYLEEVINDAIDLNKTVFINFSHHPTDQDKRNNFANTLYTLDKDTNITMAYASGNSYVITQKYIENTDINTSELDMFIWEELNKQENEKSYLVLKNPNNKKFYKDLSFIVKRAVDNVLKKQNYINTNKDEIINFYVDKLETFLLTAYLQTKTKKIIFVSAHTPFSHEIVNQYGYLGSYEKYKKMNIPPKDVASYDNNYSLDCRIKGLIDYKKSDNNVRNFGQYPHTSNGTSQAAPAELAEKVLESIKKEKEKQ